VKDGGNWYVYVENNPLIAMDPWGLDVADIYFGSDKTEFTITEFKYADDGYYHVREVIPAADGDVEYDSKSNTVTITVHNYTFKVSIKEINKAKNKEETITSEGKSLRFRFWNRLFGGDKLFVNLGDINSLTDKDKALHIVSQTSGAEIPYEPDLWNANNAVRLRTNCYAYALDMKTHADGRSFLSRDEAKRASNDVEYFKILICDYKLTEISFALQPGMYSGKEFSMSIMQNSKSFYEFCYKDMKANPAIADVKKISRFSSISAGYYRVCLVTADEDYHWYRQNPNGTWSHKPGAETVIQMDASNEIIYDPTLADRNGAFNYHTVVGYYAIKKA
jgi:hypothetical protein